MSKNLERRTKETRKLPINLTRTLEDGSELSLEISQLNYGSARSLTGVETGQVIIEKVLKVRLQRRGDYPVLSKASSPKESWEIPPEDYLEFFRNAKTFGDAQDYIKRICGKEQGWNRRTL